MCEQVNNAMDEKKTVAGVVISDIAGGYVEAAAENGVATLVCRVEESERQTVSWCDVLSGVVAGQTAIAEYKLLFEKGVRSQVVVDINDAVRGDLNSLFVEVGSGADVDIVITQNTAKNASQKLSVVVDVKDNARMSLSTIILGSDSTSDDITVNMQGEHSSATLNGLYMQGGNAHTTTQVCMNHLVPHCHSNQLFKGIVGEEAFCEFKGLIRVSPNAQKTEAFQTNRNMLLSESARVKAEPHLEIYADDVKCSHGATSGQLDAQQLFYMQQRGISAEMAKKLLMAAFAAEVVEKIPVESVRETLLAQLTNIED